MRRPALWTVGELTEERLGSSVVWTTKGRCRDVEALLPFPVFEGPPDSVSELSTLIVVGGGTVIDEAKVWRAETNPGLKLVAIASIWGSGAEASPVAVLNREGRKVVEVGEHLLPDVRVVLPELIETVTPRQARAACGDTWAHALEGFFSPLARDLLRQELAALIRELTGTPTEVDARWFELSVRACEGQARSSVGLVHGIAHTLECLLDEADRAPRTGHAAICATFLWPVMSLNRALSSTWDELATRWNLDTGKILDVVRSLHDPALFERALPFLEQKWRAILRDPCTRTNGAFVGPREIEWFVSGAFR